MGMNILFVVSILVAIGVVARWIVVHVRPSIVGDVLGKLDTNQAKTAIRLPPLTPTTDTVVGNLPEVDVRPWLEGARVPPPPSVDFGLLGFDENREADDVAIWRTVRKVLATRREANVVTGKS